MKERMEEHTHIAVKKDEYKKLKEQAELYKEALSKTRYAIHTQISTMNHQENTNLERSYMKGILFASKMINRYFNKVVERLEEPK